MPKQLVHFTVDPNNKVCVELKVEPIVIGGIEFHVSDYYDDNGKKSKKEIAISRRGIFIAAAPIDTPDLKKWFIGEVRRIWPGKDGKADVPAFVLGLVDHMKQFASVARLRNSFFENEKKTLLETVKAAR